VITRNLFRDDILREFMTDAPGLRPGARVMIMEGDRLLPGVVETVDGDRLRVRTSGEVVEVPADEVLDLGVRWCVVEGGRP